LLLSQSLTLFTTPVIYLYLDRLNNRLTARWRRTHREAALVDAIETAPEAHAAPEPQA